MAESNGALIGGRYQLLELIGRGGMGRVWRGRDETLGREVAVKEVTLPEGVGEEQREVLLQRVMREAKAAARLNHPGIITVHDVVEHEGAPVIVMEFVTGLSLGAVVAGEGGLPVRRVAEIGVLLLKALREAHAAGIVHRDLKPDNVLLMGDRVIITDFGIAHLADATTALTHTGTVIGTPSYMAPEQLEGRPPALPQDLWSLGATLYSAVEGRPPFTAETFTALCVAIATQEPPLPGRAGALAPVLTALLTKDPARRATADQALAALEAVAAGDAQGAAPHFAVRPVGAPVYIGGPAPFGEPERFDEPGSTGVPEPAGATRPPRRGPALRLEPAQTLAVRGVACIALVWAGAAVLPWNHRVSGLVVFLMALVTAALNTSLRPHPSAVRGWLWFATVNTALFAVVGVFLPSLQGWEILRVALWNGLPLATCCWALWWVLPDRRTR
ncbi:protein kinase [Streptomyces sp. NBC_00249]|uniref:serine/threonine-protein kinase n=1 Tax=Streptomyces sp. NBC_00249 TaxID=2975690 RepID=UPI002253C470|nr:serine/threonine-protein kinase [Streptomyces sp. NBC_00249]MCX5192518.1 protein kinase [Streptomyces sp. NBC_00249]